MSTSRPRTGATHGSLVEEPEGIGIRREFVECVGCEFAVSCSAVGGEQGVLFGQGPTFLAICPAGVVGHGFEQLGLSGGQQMPEDYDMARDSFSSQDPLEHPTVTSCAGGFMRRLVVGP